MDIRSASIYANIEFRDTFAASDTNSEENSKNNTLRRSILAEEGPPFEQYHAAWLGIRLVLKNYYGMFLSRKLVTDSLLERCGAFIKQEIKRTQADQRHREYLANSKDLWSVLTDVFDLGTRVLRIQSFPNAPSYDEHGCSFSNFMASNHPHLIKDIERLNDLLTLSRNMLITRKATQEAAASARFDQQVLQVVDACIRVTARGYDGEQNNTTESKWANIIAAYKKLTITALQWMYTFVSHNERRKLHLFNQLFGDFHVSDLDYEHEQASLNQVAEKITEQFPLSLDNFDPNVFQEAPALKVMDEIIRSVQGYCQQTMRQTPEYPHDFPQKQYGDFLVSVLNSLKDKQASGKNDSGSSPTFAELPTAYFKQIRGESIPVEAVEVAGPEQAAQEILEAKEKVLSEFLYQMAETDRTGSYDSRAPPELRVSPRSGTPIHGKMTYPAPPSHHASAGQMLELGDEDPEDDYEQDDEDDDEEDDEEDDEDDEDVDEEDSEDEVGSASRGLLTDIPLVLGPNEIDALPMMIQASIRSSIDPKDTTDEVHVMQALRCYRMINESAGRNLLRELLIFIAAWDLQEHELYFSLMMSIMDTILGYGLMPFAFDSFSEDKDVVSPAQSILIKLLTQMFRRRQSDAAPEAFETKPSAQFPAPPDVETTIVRYIFTVFRTHIIPQTCALIYLQGQIRLGKVLPEDFPLNLWDMERVYEGVYQFLEFFAVLTESETWKALLVKEEIVFELITLLRELDVSIPKSSEVRPPQSLSQEELALVHAEMAEKKRSSAAAAVQEAAGAAQPPATQDPTSSAPGAAAPATALVSVERPYDPSPPLSAETGTFPAAVGGGAGAGAVVGGHDPAGSETASALMENNIEPADFEWRNLKKLVVLVLSSLVWRSPTVQDQIRAHGGVEMILNCCNADGNNPYIKDHAVMCLRFLLEGSKDNQRIVRDLEDKRATERAVGGQQHQQEQQEEEQLQKEEQQQQKPKQQQEEHQKKGGKQIKGNK